jgi:hypothetical protein
MWIMIVTIGDDVISQLYFSSLEAAIAGGYSNHYEENEVVSIAHD